MSGRNISRWARGLLASIMLATGTAQAADVESPNYRIPNLTVTGAAGDASGTGVRLRWSVGETLSAQSDGDLGARLGFLRTVIAYTDRPPLRPLPAFARVERFEADRYLPDLPLDGQQGWSAFGLGSAEVGDGFAATGVQSVEIAQGDAGEDGVRFPIGLATRNRQRISAQTTVFIPSTPPSGNLGTWTVGRLAFGVGGSEDRNIELNVIEEPTSAVGELSVFAGLATRSAGFVSLDRWNRFEQVLDVPSQTLEVFLNGRLVEAGPYELDPTRILASFELLKVKGDMPAVFDDVDVRIDETTLFDTSMEGPEYQLLAIAGQNGWASFLDGGNADVGTAAAAGGQGITITRGSGEGPDAIARVFREPTLGRRVEIGVSAFLGFASTFSEWTVLDSGFDRGRIVVRVSPSGRVQVVYDGVVHDPGYFVDREQWNRFEQIISPIGPSAAWIEVRVNGERIHAGEGLNVGNVELRDAFFRGSQVANDFLHIDDLRITLPEPGLVIPVALGGTLLAGAARRRIRRSRP
ncbi:MAG: hypothetical protein NXI30_02570 [bacterium]|nr:hypothetical protein [bacterium]